MQISSYGEARSRASLLPEIEKGDGMRSGVMADAIFEKVKAQLKAQLGTEVYSSWFASMRVSEASGAIVRVSVATAFLKGWINGHYLDLVSKLWIEQDPKVLRVEIVVRNTNRAVMQQQAAAATARKPVPGAQTVIPLSAARVERFQAGTAPDSEMKQTVLGSPLDPRYTFSTFVEGSTNRVALAAAKSVAEQTSRFNPLFLHAAVGLGKTHILQAIAAESIRLAPKTRVVYLTAEYFMWRFATAIRDNNALNFKEQLRDIDILIIDDMQFLQGKSIQNEFCHLINMLLDSAKQVVVAADRPPAELESLEPRVRSRLNGGVALEMSAPDHAMRLGMLKQRLAAAKADDPSVEIREDIIEHVARIVTASGRELEGAFNQLLFRRTFEPELTVDRVDDILGPIFRSGEPKKTRIEDIQRVVARHYNVSKTELLSNRRTRTIVKPRQVAMYLAKIMTPRSLPEIGRRFGNRDHTTVLHAVRKIEGLCGSDNTLAQEVELLRRLIADQA